MYLEFIYFLINPSLLAMVYSNVTIKQEVDDGELIFPDFANSSVEQVVESYDFHPDPCGPQAQSEGLLQVQSAAISNQQIALSSLWLSQDDDTKSAEHILFRNLRCTIEAQDAWLKEKQSSSTTNPSAGKELVQVRSHWKKRCVRKQLYYEHLSWLSVAATIPPDATVEISRDGKLAWVPAFKHEHKEENQVFTQDARPGSESHLDYLLRGKARIT